MVSAFASSSVFLVGYVLYHYAHGDTQYQGEGAIRWNDRDIGIDWPLDVEPIVSARDAQAQSLTEWLQRPESDVFKY